MAAFNTAHLTFPGRHLGGPRAGELYFKPLTHDVVLDVLHNPAYDGLTSMAAARPAPAWTGTFTATSSR